MSLPMDAELGLLLACLLRGGVAYVFDVRWLWRRYLHWRRWRRWTEDA